MAKKKAAADFNMSEVVREGLTLNPKASAKEIQDFVEAKYPTAKINKGSFSVAYYTTRKKLGIKSVGGKKRGRKVGIRTSQAKKKTSVDMAALQQAAKFLREVGGAEAAIEAIKQVQAVQVK